jgi:hypothetical protein
MKNERVLEKLAADYAAVTGVARTYLCPLCLDKEFTSVTDKGLTWDHVPAKRIGGQLQIPVCRPCNSRAGATIEAHLDRYVRRLAFTEKYGKAAPVIMTMPGTGVRHRQALSRRDGALVFVGRDEANPPDATNQMEDALKNAFQENSRLTIKTDTRLTWSQRSIECAFIKAAYLAVFWRLGYHAILSEAFEPVRRQIAAPDSDVMKRFVAQATRTADDRRIKLGVINRGQDSECLLVYFQGFEMDTDTAVLVPVPSDVRLRKYEKAGEGFKPGKTFETT